MKKTLLQYVLVAALVTTVVLGYGPAEAQYQQQDGKDRQYKRLACPDCKEGDMNYQGPSEKIPQKESPEQPITIKTDKSSYSIGSIVTVSGKVNEIIKGHDITVTVTAPNGNIVDVTQVKVPSSGKYQADFNTGSPLWKQDGKYSVEATYTVLSKNIKTQFTLEGAVSGKKCSTSEMTFTDTAGNSHCVPYTIDGARVSSTEIDTGAQSLIVNLKSSSGGTLSMDIPRNVLDAKSNGKDQKFFVWANEQELRSFDETSTTANSRTVEIQFPAGTEKIEVIGTFVVPEFGPIAALVLAVAIISIIAISARTKLIPMYRYSN